MKVYIAGKITGNKKYHEMFDLAERVYSKKYIVLNPATLPEGMSAADYMRICFAMIDAADLVAFLPGWRTSPGARLERAYCSYIGKGTIEFECKEGGV
nr:MAG TPA: N-deoxyribosyltransferase [Caudoviricetes sp.]DAI99230.1 MAG TPA: N-deoxyribosyltransferase [Caudoviricetes sp.]